MKKRILIVLASLTVIIAMTTTGVYGANYETGRYDTTITVKEDYTAYVREDIHIDIQSPIHGIFRYIPLKNKISYSDTNGNFIKEVKSRIRIKDISVANYMYKTSNENGNKIIKIGDPDVYVSGHQQYSLSYLVEFFNDRVSEYDSFYYNVIPHDWETPIDSAKIVITMPKAFDERNLNVISGFSWSNSSTDKVQWTVSGNTITITTTAPLEKGEGITVGILLPEGYFVGVASNNGIIIGVMATCIIAAAILLALWFLFGRDPKVVKTVEFYPPEGMTSGEIGYVIDGAVNKEDVISLIVYMAQKGYLYIEETGNNKFILHAIKDPPSNEKTHIKTMFRGIFDGTNHIGISDLSSDFYTTYKRVSDQIEDQFTRSNGTAIYSSKSNKFTLLGYIITGVTICAVGLLTNIWVQEDIVTLGIALAITAMFYWISIIYGVRASDKKYVSKRLSKFATNVVSIVTLVISIMISIAFISSSFSSFIPVLGVLIFEIAGYFSVRFMKSRTKYGAAMLGRILGFKRFIELSDMDRLNLLVNENPAYFYDILPYAYVLGLSKKWIRKFEAINVAPPSWYYSQNFNQGNYMFNVWTMNNIMSSMTTDIGRSISPPSSSGSSGSFGGGGGGFSSGGGFGGGGGGSW